MKIQKKKRSADRDKTWTELEREIQNRAKLKDKSFVLSGKWKKFVRKQEGYKIFLVDGSWVRDNLCVYFSHGGHGWVNEFIPKDELWIASHHYSEGKSVLSNCGCKVKNKNQKVSKNYFDSSVMHEITECNLMKKGMGYWPAHQRALQKEREIGLLKDPFDDT